MFLFDIVQLGENEDPHPWNVVALCGSANEEDTWLFDLFNNQNLKQGEIDKWLSIFSQSAESGPEAISKKLRHEIDKSNKLYEFINGNWRIAWFYDEGKLIVCTHYFRKKTQKTKKQDKDRAMREKQAYFAAKTNGSLKIMR